MGCFDLEAGKLGFGLMRLPNLESGEIDVEQVCEMVDLFMDAGYNYFDTAWAYEGSEEAIRKALVERYSRESFLLATKIAPWISAKSREEAWGAFDESLERSGAGYFDFYLLHNLGQGRTRSFDKFEMWDFVKKLKEEGRVKHIGFSAHSTPEELDAILTEHPEMEFVQLQINYADWDNAAIQSRRCYEVARAHDIPIVIMEPVKGGMLAKPPASVQAILEEAEPSSTPASWALRFAADLDGVFTVLSGMSTIEQIRQNIETLDGFNGLDDLQRDVLTRAQEELTRFPLIPCTVCDYCAKVCPKDIGVSGTFTSMNYLTLYNDLKYSRHQENWLVKKQGHTSATECIGCGACEAVCTQHIAIVDELKRCVDALGLAEERSE